LDKDSCFLGFLRDSIPAKKKVSREEIVEALQFSLAMLHEEKSKAASNYSQARFVNQEFVVIYCFDQ
jgi:hypothetical protein